MPPPFVTTADAVARETAWLTTSGDSLPALLTSAGGKWDVIQGYAPRAWAPGARKNQIWVLRRSIRIERFGDIRRMAKYEFELVLNWALSSRTGSAEADQTAFDAAIDDVVTRIGGLLQDKTHGGRFLSVAEDPTLIDVTFEPPMQTISEARFEAHITYGADDFDFNG